MAKRKKSYIEQMLAWKYRMIPGYTDDEEQPVPPVPPGPGPEPGGGEIDPENPTVVDFGSETVVEPVDPEQPNVRILSVGSEVTVEPESNTLVLGSAEGNTLTL